MFQFLRYLTYDRQRLHLYVEHFYVMYHRYDRQRFLHLYIYIPFYVIYYNDKQRLQLYG